ncbi:16S rRNA (cytosine(1402)-N(4))-methyltransferase RsmH [Candidatus Chazhemtobacterium aquaticus]|uniref:Ribosomal RNA small subunit methyltransferase H n=1 Tax=Candidatus Chazhemtobacterium aquaticus TaxID=2715735 RepID=A0A857N634_9BACT|nr:16S rRNA (cytosine(1402)-N(4))-methyltransferase RsmH [Candidatus Chazhemtobacterium aquaticus]QHO63536.1 16S rRNA (cytosine(1402)-N(4))-methyltransferase [Candidatus Chazhemtobacterium aquaticus]
MTEYQHQPVLLKEALEYLQVKPGRIYLDATLGDGGHTQAILEKGASVIAIDQDPQALERASARLQSACPDINIKLDVKLPVTQVEAKTCLLIRSNFANLDQLINLPIDGILFDLGVSTLQILMPQRGFTFQSEGPLDMRMDPDLGVTAADLLMALSQKELTRLLLELGDETFAAKIARRIVKVRQRTPIVTTTQLADLVARIKPHGKIHPATKTFQALRMAVNQERYSLTQALPQALRLLKKQGRLVIISFHSGEDRLVKHFLKEQAESNNLEILTSKPVKPTVLEINQNHKARSAKLRAAAKQ